MERDFAYDESTIVQTKQGKVKGYRVDDLYIFKGIPYAQARRFMAPEPVPAWEGVKDASSFGYVCPRLQQEKPSGELQVPHRYWPSDEDCLNLNLWTPGPDGKRRPVLVWLHGGGYSAGSSIEHLAYEGENLSRTGDVVVVSVNHRLNILGYLDLSDYGEKYAHSGNAGGSDIVAALKWVRDNIAAFGGDPDNVTLFGQSGGGNKIITLLQTPEADGLYHKGLIMSGLWLSHMSDREDGDARPLIQALLKELNLAEEQVEELETAPYYKLAEAYNKVSPELKKQGCYVGCTPRRNQEYIGNPVEVGFRPKTRNIPLMIGTVFGEFAFFLLPYDRKNLAREEGAKILEKYYGEDGVKRLLPLFEKVYPKRNPIDLLYLDFLFRPATAEFIRKRVEEGSAPVYSYLFDVDFPIGLGKPAWHCADVPFFFRNTNMAPAMNVKGVTNRLEQEMSECLLSFAADGKPSCEGMAEWPECVPGEEKVMMLGVGSHVQTNPDNELMAELWPLAGDAFGKLMADTAIQY